MDFEVLVERDEVAAPWSESPSPPLPRRGREGGSRRDVFHAWLAEQRTRSPAALPGEAYTRGRRIVQTLAIVFGLVAGFALCSSLLARRDAEPVNALMFFGVTVGIQLAFLVLVFCAWLMRKAGLRIRPLQDLLWALVGLCGRAMHHLDGADRMALRARWAAMQRHSTRLAPLIGCDLLGVTQTFAIAFNLGLLAAMLLVHLPFEELRFGWQSTYSFTNDGVHEATRIVAAPWHWIAEPLAPDAAQVAATRYTRGQRAETLPADAAHAWWPFLLAAIAFYGLLVRSLLAAGAAMLLRSRLARLDFASPAANALWRRLQGPLVASEGGDETLPHPTTTGVGHASRGADLLVIDDELAAHADAVRAMVESAMQGPVAHVATSNVDDDALAADLAGHLAPRLASIVIATPADRDPIVAVASFLRALSSAARRDCELVLMLVGDPIDAAVDDERLSIWKRFVAIQRLRIGVERAS